MFSPSFLSAAARWAVLTFSLACTLACQGHKNTEPTTGNVEKPAYARLFDTRETPQGVLVTTYQPADTSKILKRYLLYREGHQPDTIPPDVVPVRIPLENVAVAHSTQIGLIAALGCEQSIRSIGSRAALERNSVLAEREDFSTAGSSIPKNCWSSRPMPYSSPRDAPKTSPRSKKASAYRCSTTFPLGKTTRWPAANG